MNIGAILFGGFITLSVWLAVASRQQATQEFVVRVFKPINRASHKRGLSLATYKAILQAEAEAIDEPEKATLWIRLATITSAMVVSLSVLLRQPAVLFLIPVVFAMPAWSSGRLH